jgi:hypothetical protein
MRQTDSEPRIENGSLLKGHNGTGEYSEPVIGLGNNSDWKVFLPVSVLSE